MIRLKWKFVTPATCAKPLIMAALATLLPSVPASAGGDAAPQQLASPAAAVAEGSLTNPIFVVPYWRSEPGISTVISISNLGTTPCLTTVDWFQGNTNELRCRTSLTVGGGTPVGQALEHRTRSTTVVCDLPATRAACSASAERETRSSESSRAARTRSPSTPAPDYKDHTELEDVSAVARPEGRPASGGTREIEGAARPLDGEACARGTSPFPGVPARLRTPPPTQRERVPFKGPPSRRRSERGAD